ncbi:MAG: fructose-6-phosphate aldolase [Acidobacteria bacterium]|nr:fructose-6-phosphate aldolase [Acidobacteriota bacterium]
MKIFLDTGNVEEIRRAAALGLLDGVTTNPTLLAKEGKPFREALLEMCALVDIVNGEVVATDAEGMIAEGREIASLHPNIVVKIPMTPEGFKAIKVLRGEGIRINVTLVFSPAQALLVAKAGAYFVSPFLGRVDDVGGDGLKLLRDIIEVYRPYKFDTQVLAASLRHPMHVVEAAKLGADIATMPYKVFEQLFKHPLTDRGLEAFLKDWEKARAVLGDILPAEVKTGRK